MSASRRIFLAIALLMPLTILASCSDDDDPVSPPFRFPATMETLWPHVDGNSWTYRLTTEECEHAGPAFYENLEDLPPIPSFEELYARLKNGIPCDRPATSSGSLELVFEGEVAISPTDTVQRLRSTVEAEEGWPIRPFGFSGSLWAMRPDRIVAYPDWKNDDWLSWVYLTNELEPGAEFVYQLSPAQVDNLFLQGRIWRHVRDNLSDGSTVNGVECFYFLDLGVQQATDESGQILGYARTYIYGLVHYGQDIGPVYGREQREMLQQDVIQDLPSYRGTIDSKFHLTNRGRLR